MTPEQQIRHSIREQRRSLEGYERAGLSAAINRHITHSLYFRRAQRIAGYIAADGEVLLDMVFRTTCERKKSWYLPILDQLNDNRLWFAPCNEHSAYRLNRYGIPEPTCIAQQRSRPLALNLILVPLVAYDTHGNRIGMGGGFYDRSLAFLKQRQHWHRPVLLGVAYSFQRVAKIKSREWDIPLDAIVTEEGVQSF